MKELFKLSDNFTTQNIILIILGMMIYFGTEFKTKWGKSDFSFKVFVIQNWVNLIINIAAVLALFMIADNVSKIEAFGMGLMPSWAVDKVQDAVAKVQGKRE